MAQHRLLASTTLAQVSEGVVTSMVATTSYIIAGLNNGSLYVWNHECTNQRVIQVGEKALWALDTCSDEWVVVGGFDGVLSVWDLTTLHRKSDLRGHTSTVRCAIAYSSNKVVSASADTTIRLWDIETGDSTGVLEGHTKTVRSMAVYGNILVPASYDFDGRIWNMDTRECLSVLTGHESQIYSMVFDGTRTKTSSLDKTARVWDAETGTCLAILRAHSAPAIMGQLKLFHNTLLTRDSKGNLRKWTMKDYTEIRVVHGHRSAITSMDVSARKIVTGGSDGAVKEYDSESGELSHEFATADGVWKVAYIGEKVVAVFSREKQIVLWIWKVE